MAKKKEKKSDFDVSDYFKEHEKWVKNIKKISLEYVGNPEPEVIDGKNIIDYFTNSGFEGPTFYIIKTKIKEMHINSTSLTKMEIIMKGEA